VSAPVDPAAVAANVAAARRRIERAGGAGVEIVAVTKTFGADAVLAAAAAGCDGIGESYAQEVAAKWRELAGRQLPALHFIGRLQTNKVRSLVPHVASYDTVDREALAAEIARRAPGARVMVQVSPAGEPDKGGCPAADVPRLVERASALGLTVVGLLAVGPTEGGPEAARPGFRRVRALADELGIATCSMGMTDDLEVAVEEGATQVRLGSALFGPRPHRH